MAKKLVVPQEFEVFIDDALDLIEESKTPERLHAVMENMAKFRYYLKGRVTSLDQVLVEGNPSKVTIQYIVEELERIKKIERNVNVIFKAITDADIERNQRNKDQTST